jgi:hypothetical protein
MIQPLLRFGRARMRLAAALAGGVVFLAGGAWALSALTVPSRPPTGPAGPGAPAAAAAEGRPHPLGPTLRLPGLLDEASVRQAVGRLTLGRVGPVSQALHVVRLFGPAAECSTAQGRVVLLDTLLEHEQSLAFFDGRPTLIDTRYGVRCKTQERRNAQQQLYRETHANQLLAVLGEVGVPLNHPVSTADGRRAVRDLLNDAMATFELGQVEIEWSALAFALYLPPQDSWQDQHGTRHTFDELAREMMRRPFHANLPCAGTHLLYSLTALLRADEEAPVLSEPVRAQLREHLRQAVQRVCSAQAADGSWDLLWYEDLVRPAGPPPASVSPPANVPAVLATGHQAEWLIRLPPELLPPEDCLARAARWLHVRLLADPASMLEENYCPYSHAGKVLAELVLTPPVRPEGPEEQCPAASR